MYGPGGCFDNVVTKNTWKARDSFVAFMDLQKAYDRVDRDALQRVQKIYI